MVHPLQVSPDYVEPPIYTCSQCGREAYSLMRVECSDGADRYYCGYDCADKSGQVCARCTELLEYCCCGKTCDDCSESVDLCACADYCHDCNELHKNCQCGAEEWRK